MFWQTYPDWLPLLPLACSLASIVASAALLRWVWTLQGALANTLMARQLWHLALADLISSTLYTPWGMMNLLHSVSGHGSQGSPALDLVCNFAMLDNIAMMASAATEVHIAFSLGASVFRCTGALRVFSKALPFVWLLGLILGLPVVLIGDAYFSAAEGECNTRSMIGEEFEVGVWAVAFLISLAIYIAVVVMVERNSGSPAQARVHRRVGLFMFAAAVSWAPYIVYVLVSKDLGDNAIAYNLCFASLQSNGLLNALAYKRRSGLERRILRGRSAGGAGVCLQEVGDAISFEVTFQAAPQVYRVTAVTADANRTAMQEMQAPNGAEVLLCFEAPQASSATGEPGIG